MDISHSISINEVAHLKNHHCDRKMNRKFDHIWHQHIARHNEMMFGCSVPMHPRVYSTETKNEIEVCRNSASGLNALNYFNENHDVAPTHELAPCARFEFDLGIPDIDDTNNDMNEAYLKLYLNAEVPVKTTILYYDSVELGAEVGGFIGMILGISLVDLAESLSTLIDVIIRNKLE